nr:reverse transcriptase domain-containing protein [Enterobacter cloacae complex sp. 2DZ2F20B]
MWECMERRGLSEKLIVAAREIYRETVTSVRVRGIESEMFWTTKGLRQGCPLSPSLFACYISDIEEMFRGVQAGGIVVGREKVWCLAFADDLAKDECGMNEMKKNLPRYFKRNKLEVNVEKTKMMVFRKKARKGEEKVWRWEDRIIDTVKEFKYLGFKFTTTNTVKAHIRERRVKAMQIMGMVWSIGERIFGHDVRRRMKMFDSLVRSVLMYGWRYGDGRNMQRWKQYKKNI